MTGRPSELLPQTGRADAPPPRSANHLLASLSDSDFALLEPHLESVTCEVRDAFEEPNRPIERIYFPKSGILSVVAVVSRDRPIEVGLIGREGMSGIAVVIGNDRSPHSTYVQVAGAAQRIGSHDLRRAMQESSSLRLSLLPFVQAFMTQTAHTAVANGRAKLEERLARWLLMAHDRLDGDALPLTHEFISLMLGVRRPGVTSAFQLLEQKGIVHTRRGMTVIVDRAGAHAGQWAGRGTSYTRLGNGER